MKEQSSNYFDVVIVGAGIVGLAHAYESISRGYSTLMIDRDARCTGASVRNFGFVTVSGQRAGDTWRRARYSRDVWETVCDQARIPIVHRGSWIACHRDEAVHVAEAFLATEMGQDCRLFFKSDFASLLQEFPQVRSIFLEDMQAMLYSPYELRVESRDAIPRLAAWLEEDQRVKFRWSTEVFQVENGMVYTSVGDFRAGKTIVCTGGALSGVARPALAGYDLSLCTLQMLRVRTTNSITLPGSVMTDNSLARYHGWADLPEAQTLKTRIKREMPEYLSAGVHLIAVQSADGTLVLGDSHVYGSAESVYASDEFDRLILNLARRVLDLGHFEVVERWSGVYPVWAGGDAIIHPSGNDQALAVVTSGTGASTAFGLANDTFKLWE